MLRRYLFLTSSPGSSRNTYQEMALDFE